MSLDLLLGTMLRYLSNALFFVLPRQKAINLERRCRGFEESLKIRSSDIVIVSFGKSGRTWLRVMLSRFFQIRFSLSPRMLIDHANFHQLNSSVPTVFFTHDNYAKDYLGKDKIRELYGNRRTILLVRDPIDVAVSQYFQWKNRMLPRKKIINNYPFAEEDISILQFVMASEYGIPKIVRFYNDWIDTIQNDKNVLVIKYESLRADTAQTLEKILSFMGFHSTPSEIADCVAFGSVDSMRNLEAQGFFADSRMKALDPNNPDSFKVRRASASGNRDYFAKKDVEAMEAYIATHLKPGFGY
jgi:hypothetical protein